MFGEIVNGDETIIYQIYEIQCWRMDSNARNLIFYSWGSRIAGALEEFICIMFPEVDLTRSQIIGYPARLALSLYNMQIALLLGVKV